MKKDGQISDHPLSSLGKGYCLQVTYEQ